MTTSLDFKHLRWRNQEIQLESLLADLYKPIGDVRYVKTPDQGGNDNNDGTSWARAKATIKAAANSLTPRDQGGVTVNAGDVYIGPGLFTEYDIPITAWLRYHGSGPGFVTSGTGDRKDRTLGTFIELDDQNGVHVFRTPQALEDLNEWMHLSYIENLSIDGRQQFAPARPETSSINLTFNNTSPATVARASGDFVAEGYVVGDIFEVVGSASNDGLYEVATVDSGTITLRSDQEFAAEGPTSSPTLKVVRVMGLRYFDPGFNSILRSVNLRNCDVGLYIKRNALNLHMYDITGSGMRNRLGFGDFEGSPVAVAMWGGQFDNCGPTWFEIHERGSGSGQNFLFDGIKLESTTTDQHLKGISTRPHPTAGTAHICTVRNMVSMRSPSDGGGAVIHEQNATGAAWNFNLENIREQNHSGGCFSSDKTGDSSFRQSATNVSTLRKGTFRGRETYSGIRSPAMEIDGFRVWRVEAAPNTISMLDDEPVGTIAINENGGTSTTMWVKEGAGSGGWAAK